MSHQTADSRDLAKQQADGQNEQAVKQRGTLNANPDMSKQQADDLVTKQRHDHQEALDKQNASDIKNQHTGGSPTPVYKPWAMDTTVPPSVASLAERFDALEHHFKAIDDRFIQLERELGIHRSRTVGALTMDKSNDSRNDSRGNDKAHPPLTGDKLSYAGEDSQDRGQGRKA